MPSDDNSPLAMAIHDLRLGARDCDCIGCSSAGLVLAELERLQGENERLQLEVEGVPRFLRVAREEYARGKPGEAAP